jgi:hypothetical protein
MPTPLSKDELTPHALVFFKQLKDVLPITIAERLRSNRHVVTHGSYIDLYLFDIWDIHQNDVLGRQHFKYCLAYDPSLRNHSKHDGYFHLWLNTIRIYRQREEIVEVLNRTLPKVIGPEFKYDRQQRAISAGRTFTYPKNLAELPGMLIPFYQKLIGAVHPILMPLIDRFSTGLDPGERRTVVAKRGFLTYNHPGVRDRDRVREYTRSIPPSWKPILLEKYGYRCFICGTDLARGTYHFDHWRPFSKEGPTTMENIRPLCAACNLKKGNRSPSV